MQQRFRRGAISIGPARCDGCDSIIHHGDVYLAIDEKPSDKLKEEVIYLDELDCSDCGKSIENDDEYLLVIDGEDEKCYCPACYKKKGGETFRKKNCGWAIIFRKSAQESRELRFCRSCCEKRKAGVEKKEKGDKVFTFFPSKTLK